MAMIKTSWVTYTEGRHSYRIRATYGVDEAFAKRFNQDPHFSITAETEQLAGSRWHEDSGGCMHDKIAEHFPKLAPLIKWHLFGVTGGPLHYIANALYFLDIAAKRVKPSAYSPEPIGAFKNTIVYGVLACEGEEINAQARRDEVKTWLEGRLPALVEAFQADMKLAEVTW